MQESKLRWCVIGFATLMYGFPLSVLSDLWGYGTVVGWLAGLIVVLLGDLFSFVWWRGLVVQKAGVRVVSWRRR